MKSASRSDYFTSEKMHGIHWLVVRVDARAGVDVVAKRRIPAPAGNRTPVVQTYPFTLTTELPRITGGYGPVVGSSEHNNEPSGSVKGGVIVD